MNLPPDAGVQPSDADILYLWDTHVGDPTAKYPFTDEDKVTFARALLSRFGTRPAAEPNPWKQAIDDELVTIESTADSYPTAKAAVKALIDWNVSVALDPAVSSDAQALIDKGRAQAGSAGEAVRVNTTYADTEFRDDAGKLLAVVCAGPHQAAMVSALSARSPEAQGEYTYASKQETQCAGCGKRKHTPLRIDAMGGYVCLTCIDQKLGSLLGEFGADDTEAASDIVAWLRANTNEFGAAERIEARFAATAPAQGESAAPAEPAMIWKTTHKAVCVPITESKEVADGWRAQGWEVIAYTTPPAAIPEAPKVTRDEDEQYAIERAADLLEAYADWIKRNVMSADIEAHPYLPEIEGTAEDLRALAASPVHVSEAPTPLTPEEHQVLRSAVRDSAEVVAPGRMEEPAHPAWCSCGACNAEPAKTEAAELIIRDVCEMEPANPDLNDTICIDVSDLLRIVKRHIRREK